MSKSVTRNYIYNLTYQILLVVLPLFTMPYISRVLGVEQVGRYSYVSTVVTYFVVLSQLGLGLYGRRQIAYVRNDRTKTTELFWKLISIRLFNYSIGISIYCIRFIESDENNLYYAILLPYIIGSAIDITWLFQAFEEFGKIVFRNIVVKLLHILSVFIFVRTRDSLWIYITIISVSEFVSQAVMWLGIKKIVDIRPLSLKNCGMHLKGALIMFLPQIITTLYTLADKLILGFLSTDTEVGLYSQSERIIKLTLTIVSSMGAVAMPRISNDYANGKIENVRTRLTKNKQFIIFLAVPMIGGIYGIADGFVPWFFGPGYEKVSSLMVIISPIILMIALSDLFGMQFLIPTGHMHEYTLATIGGAVINVILNIILVKGFASVGVSIATVVSEFSVTFMMWQFSRKYIKLEHISIIPYVVAGIMMSLAVKILDVYSPDIVIVTIAEILLGIFIYGGILLLLKDEMIRMAFMKVKQSFTFNLKKR